MPMPSRDARNPATGAGLALALNALVSVLRPISRSCRKAYHRQTRSPSCPRTATHSRSTAASDREHGVDGRVLLYGHQHRLSIAFIDVRFSSTESVIFPDSLGADF